MKSETVKTGMKIGATIGGLAFLAVGIMPGFYFGSYGALTLLQKLAGGAIEPTLIVRAVVVMGIAIGIVCSAAVSLVVGGLIGTAFGSLVTLPVAMKKATVAVQAK